jgi:hypothetical protein
MLEIPLYGKVTSYEEGVITAAAYFKNMLHMFTAVAMLVTQ